MNKKLQLIFTFGLTFSCFAFASTGIKDKAVKATDSQTYYVDFFNNYPRQVFTLSNGLVARGDNVIYKTVQVEVNGLVSKPEDPKRTNYEFKGWFKEEACENEWVFSTDIVTSDTRLFAKWGIGEKEEGTEPPYTPPSTVLEESAAQDYVIDSIMYTKIEEGQVKLTKSALDKLEASKDDVLPLMEYRVKNGKTFTATYEANAITITCNEVVEVIQVKDDSDNYIVNNSDYETKAKNYEKNAVAEESHHVMLAGSSSIEFWTTSKEDLDPIVSYNHGIGGTTIEQWDKYLNQRLVYPYKPKMVVYYVGINNVINTTQSANQIWEHLEEFFENTHAALPDTKIQYIKMNLIPGYTSYFNTINTVNEKVDQYAENNPWLTLINPGTALLKENGQPNAAYFRTDGLHLSFYGYTIWGEIIKQSIIDGLNAQ